MHVRQILTAKAREHQRQRPLALFGLQGARFVQRHAAGDELNAILPLRMEAPTRPPAGFAAMVVGHGVVRVAAIAHFLLAHHAVMLPTLVLCPVRIFASARGRRLILPILVGRGAARARRLSDIGVVRAPIVPLARLALAAPLLILLALALRARALILPLVLARSRGWLHGVPALAVPLRRV